MKKFIEMVAGAFCMALVALMLVNPVKAEAAGRNVRVTWNTSDWFMSVDNGYWCSTNGVVALLEDGDTVVIDTAGATPTSPVTVITDKKLDTLAVTGDTTLSLSLSQTIGSIYAANGATLIYTGNADYVIANAGCVTQITGNVGTLEATYVSGKADPIFAVTGTVGMLKAKMTDGVITTDLAYDFEAGTVHAYADDKGVVKVKEGTLKGAPGEKTPAKEEKKELDKVPKTGTGVSTSLVFFAVAAMLTLAGVTVKRNEHAK